MPLQLPNTTSAIFSDVAQYNKAYPNLSKFGTDINSKSVQKATINWLQFQIKDIVTKARESDMAWMQENTDAIISDMNEIIRYARQKDCVLDNTFLQHLSYLQETQKQQQNEQEPNTRCRC